MILAGLLACLVLNTFPPASREQWYEDSTIVNRRTIHEKLTATGIAPDSHRLPSSSRRLPSGTKILTNVKDDLNFGGCFFRLVEKCDKNQNLSK